MTKENLSELASVETSAVLTAAPTESTTVSTMVVRRDAIPAGMKAVKMDSTMVAQKVATMVDISGGLLDERTAAVMANQMVAYLE